MSFDCLKIFQSDISGLQNRTWRTCANSTYLFLCSFAHPFIHSSFLPAWQVVVLRLPILSIMAMCKSHISTWVKWGLNCLIRTGPLATAFSVFLLILEYLVEGRRKSSTFHSPLFLPIGHIEKTSPQSQKYTCSWQGISIHFVNEAANCSCSTADRNIIHINF